MMTKQEREKQLQERYMLAGIIFSFVITLIGGVFIFVGINEVSSKMRLQTMPQIEETSTTEQVSVEANDISFSSSSYINAGISKEIYDIQSNIENQQILKNITAGISSLNFEDVEVKAKKKKTQEKLKKKSETKKTEEKKGFPEYAEDEFLLAQIIYYEVGTCTRKDKIITGSVVINRARTKYKAFRNVTNFYEVLYQDDIGQQYADATINKIEAYYKMSYEERKKELQQMQESLEVAKGLISGKIECWPEYVLDQSTFDAETLRKWGIRKLDIDGVEETYGTPMDYGQ